MYSKIRNQTPLSIGAALLWVLAYLGMLIASSLLTSVFLGAGISAAAGIWIRIAIQVIANAIFFTVLTRSGRVVFHPFENLNQEAVLLAIGGTIFCFVVVQFGLGPFLRYMTRSQQAYTESISVYAQSPVAGFIYVGVVGPVVEEMLMRGFVQAGLQSRYGVVVGWVLSAVLFALMHLSLVQGIAALALGLVLGHLYIHTGSLFACMLMHGLYNAVVFSLTLL